MKQYGFFTFFKKFLICISLSIPSESSSGILVISTSPSRLTVRISTDLQFSHSSIFSLHKAASWLISLYDNQLVRYSSIIVSFFHRSHTFPSPENCNTSHKKHNSKIACYSVHNNPHNCSPSLASSSMRLASASLCKFFLFPLPPHIKSAYSPALFAIVTPPKIS
jgi:hypothetical protein